MNKTVPQGIGVNNALDIVDVVMTKKGISGHVIRRVVHAHVKQVIEERTVMNPVKLVLTVQIVD